MVDKNRIINIILSLALIVVFVLATSKMNSNFNKKLDETNQGLGELKQYVSSMDKSIFSLKNQIDHNQLQIADLWLSSLDEEAYKSIQDWENTHQTFTSCEKGDSDMRVSRSHYTSDIKPANVLVYMFDKGDLIYNSNGDVYCYLYPIEDMNPPKQDCDLLCLENEEE